MRIALNLASRPYFELGPLYMRLRILIAALALAAVPLWLLLRVETQKAAAAHARLAAAEQTTQALQRQQQQYRADMQQPRNASVLEQSRFLNGVFGRKAFSWTAVMMDLENVLPGGVQVLNIDPVISRNGDVTIHLRASGKHDRAVAFVRNLEHSKRFLSPRLAGESAETSAQNGRGFQQVSDSGVDVDVLAEYNPLPSESGTAGEVKKPTASTAKSGIKNGSKKAVPSHRATGATPAHSGTIAKSPAHVPGKAGSR